MTAPNLDPLVSATAGGLTTMVEYGLMGSFAVVCLGIAALLVWAILRQLIDCSKNTREGLENSTKALHGIEVVLARIEVKLDK